MSKAFEDLAELYSNIMEEARFRLGIVETALSNDTLSNIGHVAVSDLCALQFRKAFEAISLACLTAHGELAGQRLKDETYRADKVLKGLERLNPKYFPQPCQPVRDGRGWVNVDKPAAGKWLTSAELIRLYFDFDHEMHVGSLSRRSLNATALSPGSLAFTLKRTKPLVLNHYIQLVGGDTRLLFETNGLTDSGQLTLLARD